MTATVEGPSLSVQRRIEMIMGMPISLAVRGRDVDTRAVDVAWGRVVKELREVDRVFSTYRADSVISRLGRGEIDLGQCPPEVREVLEIGSRAADRSGGAFSIMLPAEDGPRLDPSGVVKGWAVERAARHLLGLDDADFCLSGGGDLVCRTPIPTAVPWRIGIEDPRDPTRVIAVVPVSRGAVATSGASRRGEHIVDARTGRPPTGVASVTVIADSLTRADVDATSAYAQGTGAVDWLAGQKGLLALVVDPEGRCVTVDNRIGPVKIIRS